MKRLTDTEKWERPWFRKLSSKQKFLWLYLCDKCEMDGVFELDIAQASFFIGESVTQDDLAALKKQIDPRSDGKFWIKDFIPFQHSSLSKIKPAHNGVFKAAAKHGINLEPFLKAAEGNEGHTGKPSRRINHDAAESGKGAVLAEPVSASPGSTSDFQDAAQIESAFEKFYAAYPRKIQKGDALRTFVEQGCARVLPQILSAIQWQQRAWAKQDDPSMIPGPKTYLENRQWTEQRMDGQRMIANPLETNMPWSEKYTIFGLTWDRNNGGPRREQFNDPGNCPKDRPWPWPSKEKQDVVFEQAVNFYQKWKSTLVPIGQKFKT